MSISQLLAPSLKRVEEILDSCLADSGTEARVAAMCRQVIHAGGKRTRPMLTLLCARAQDQFDEERHEFMMTQYAASIELLHTATLVHDDVIDRAPLRRGEPTLNDTEGNHAAVLAGDYLFTRTFITATDVGRIEYIRILNETIATLVAGEINQLRMEGSLSITLDDYYSIIYAKTGVLFELAAKTFAYMMDPADPQVQNFISYGRSLGIAYQIIDDCLDFSADAEVLGKPVGGDLQDQRITLPMILAIQSTQGRKRDELTQAIRDADFECVSHFIAVTGALERCRELAVQASETARSSLNHLRDSPYRQALLEVIDHCITRSR